jgi:hypothetical protein
MTGGLSLISTEACSFSTTDARTSLSRRGLRASVEYIGLAGSALHVQPVVSSNSLV